jgi:hypothetical protein
MTYDHERNKCHILDIIMFYTILSSYDRAKHIVEVDERILAVFIVDSVGKISDLFIAKDANINRFFIETIRTVLDIRFEGKNESTKDQPVGQHFWDILEYDEVRIIKIYESERLIVVLAKSHLPAGDIAETVLGYLYESEEEQPKSLF